MRAKANFHVPLPGDVYASLRTAAEEESTPATVLARRAIEDYLDARKRIMVREALAEYAAAVAGSPADLDVELESAASDVVAGSDT
jgi:hypothetical protein